jgi:hypothetical protein
MKAIRTQDYRIDAYGNVNFVKVDIGSGHSTFKVFWRREGAERGTRIAWLKEGLKPSQSSPSSSAKRLTPWKTGTMSTTTRVTSSSGTENRTKVFSFMNTRSDFLIVAVVPARLATPSAALGDLASSASVAARPTRGDDVLEDHDGSILCRPGAGHSVPS